MDKTDDNPEASNGSQNGSTDPETSVEQITDAHEHTDRTSNDESKL
jgi:hypothetical protein